ncbi:uncharacterized protein M421DRAFT_424089 [Didymella exigua CBS 183.55]|uniref:Uncharacterized protein n=1 Tax=Didymella exigua CBS 183.55 TaxID=1150837 RepID=A0A6A5RBN8_9PLEO|nr:uncharacterized protein M421DRAFT_424089 [Didymella exigua CBS 183.55]KAF1925062.1 hypothetical protein M421DRAFT_424089 [Didymella exigua CBS 183.55]
MGSPTLAARGGGIHRGSSRGGIALERSHHILRPSSSTTSQAIESDLPASSAAKLLVQPAIIAFNAAHPNDGEGILWDIWNSVVDDVSQTPTQDLSRVVEVLAAVADLTEPASFEIWGDRTTWKQLPLLGPVIRERWDDEQQSQAVKINTFAARLTAAGVLDLSLYAIWTLRSVLEDSEPGQVCNENKDEHCKAAAAWFIYAGDVLYTLCREEKQYDGRAARQGKNVIGESWNGYNEQRWRLWVERLEKIQDDVACTETKAVLEEALNSIKQVGPV